MVVPFVGTCRRYAWSVVVGREMLAPSGGIRRRVPVVGTHGCQMLAPTLVGMPTDVRCWHRRSSQLAFPQQDQEKRREIEWPFNSHLMAINGNEMAI